MDEPHNDLNRKQRWMPKNMLKFRAFKAAAALLLLIIVITFVVCIPWHTTNTNQRTITVSGEATLKATPDEFVFSPTYDFSNADKQVANDAAATKSGKLTAGLTAVGVKGSAVQTSIDSYNSSVTPVDTNQPTVNSAVTGAYTFTLHLTVTLPSQAQAQKVQDYLQTTGATGQITPMANFSQSLQKRLDSQARDNATKDARAKVDQSAKNLGFRVGDVKSVDDSSGFGGGVMTSGNQISGGLNSSGTTPPSLLVQPGKNELNYSVSVVYYIK